jgi:signal transduction histidine kinase
VLGLSLTFDITKAHVVTIAVQSQEGEGAELGILLPKGIWNNGENTFCD